MKILAIIGSPKGKGNTYDLVSKVETELRELEPRMEFEYQVLKNCDLQPCRGCYQCLYKGEQYCPLKDERETIEHKMSGADGVIFASPVYVCNVSWIMKNFMDRFAYRCHRPAFQKPAMVVSTTGGVGLKFVLPLMAFEVGTWGFRVASQLGMACPHGSSIDSITAAGKVAKGIKKASNRFYESLKRKSPKKPGLLKLISFSLQQKAFRNAPAETADHRYWLEKGWLDNNSFYYPVKVNPFLRIISKAISSFWFR